MVGCSLFWPARVNLGHNRFIRILTPGRKKESFVVVIRLWRLVSLNWISVGLVIHGAWIVPNILVCIWWSHSSSVIVYWTWVKCVASKAFGVAGRQRLDTCQSIIAWFLKFICFTCVNSKRVIQSRISSWLAVNTIEPKTTGSNIFLLPSVLVALSLAPEDKVKSFTFLPLIWKACGSVRWSGFAELVI